jgi:pimeloyl-ACP methyl ester carboxylesterase
MPEISLRDTTLFYQERGKGPGLLCLHGFPFDHTTWLDQLSGLNDVRRVIAVDQRGFGRSYPEAIQKIDKDVYADDAVALIESLEGGRPVDIIGFSAGAHVGCMVADRRPDLVRSITALTPLPFTGGQMPDPFAGARRQLDMAGVELFANRIKYTFGEDPPLTSLFAMARYRAMVEGARPEMFAAALVSASPDRTEMLKRLKTPLLFVFGDRTGGIPEGYADTVPPGSRIISIPDAGRLAAIENAPAFNAAVKDFWASIP